MIYHSIQNYVKAKKVWDATPGKIINGQGFVFVKGNWIPAELYYAHNTKPTYERLPPVNPDGTVIPNGVITTKK